ncbi:hypothetical protein [Siminovitchia terrae]|nr:hypothetical protein [Siminovitchia terrae]
MKRSESRIELNKSEVKLIQELLASLKNATLVASSPQVNLQ